MDTTAAALQAKVSAATIRTWCRRNVIAAIKVAGRWLVDGASLAYRVSLTAKQTTVQVTTEAVIAIGGNRWTKAGKDRVYIDGWARFLGLEISRYNTGNISYAERDGRKISNSEARRILCAIYKVYFDVPTGKLIIQWDAVIPRGLDRDDIAKAIFGGIRAEIAAL